MSKQLTNQSLKSGVPKHRFADQHQASLNLLILWYCSCFQVRNCHYAKYTAFVFFPPCTVAGVSQGLLVYKFTKIHLVPAARSNQWGGSAGRYGCDLGFQRLFIYTVNMVVVRLDKFTAGGSSNHRLHMNLNSVNSVKQWFQCDQDLFIKANSNMSITQKTIMLL